MTLLEMYAEALEGMTVKARRPVRSLWHNTAKRYLNIRSITCDPVPPLTTQTVNPNEGDETVTVLDDAGDEIEVFVAKTRKGDFVFPASYTVTVTPIDEISIRHARFINAPRHELEELYRLTKPKRGEPKDA